ncbi:MAG: glycosyltransferase [Clostridioides sp.]|jgi:glycosyltransferase involved in cell wall biosynthesis|nr:glycosyltransferase [Clostridioides sp.]
MDKPYISVIVPAYNEEKYLRDTLEGLDAIEDIDQIIIVDDGSTDNTSSIIHEFLGTGKDISKQIQTVNKGKGHALNVGLEIAMEKADIIGFVDGDLGSSSNEFKKLIGPVVSDQADVTIAQFPGAKKKGGFGLVKGLARDSVLDMTGVELTSSISGQRVFKKEVLEKFEEMPYGYGVEVGMTIDILKYGYKIVEVPVQMSHNETGRDLAGFIHRGKQYYHIRKIVKEKKKKWAKHV